MFRTYFLRTIMAAVLLTLSSSPLLNARREGHYIFTLPDNYVGWVEVIFGAPNRPALQEHDGNQIVAIGDDGVALTSSLRLHRGTTDQFFYRRAVNKDADVLVPLPADYFVNDDSHGGFGAHATRDQGPGYPWYFFIGPSAMRNKIDLEKVRKNFWNKDSREPMPGSVKIEP